MDEFEELRNQLVEGRLSSKRRERLLQLMDLQRKKIQELTKEKQDVEWDKKEARRRLSTLIPEYNELLTILSRLFHLHVYSKGSIGPHNEIPWDVADAPFEQNILATGLDSPALYEIVIDQILKERYGVDLYARFPLVVFGERALIETRSGEQFRQSPDDWQWRPGRERILARYREAGVQLAFISNQAGVGCGYLPRAEMEAALEEMARPYEMKIYTCYSHPKATGEYQREDDPRRLPGTGMLEEAMYDVGVADPKQMLLIGGNQNDLAAALKIGCGHLHGFVYFGVPS